MKIMDGFVVKNIVGTTVIIPIGQRLVEGNTPMSVVGKTEFFVKNVINETSKEELSELYMKEYNVKKEICEEDINEFIEVGKEYGFIQI